MLKLKMDESLWSLGRSGDELDCFGDGNNDSNSGGIFLVIDDREPL